MQSRPLKLQSRSGIQFTLRNMLLVMTILAVGWKVDQFRRFRQEYVPLRSLVNEFNGTVVTEADGFFESLTVADVKLQLAQRLSRVRVSPKEAEARHLNLIEIVKSGYVPRGSYIGVGHRDLDSMGDLPYFDVRDPKARRELALLISRGGDKYGQQFLLGVHIGEGVREYYSVGFRFWRIGVDYTIQPGGSPISRSVAHSSTQTSH